VRNDADVQMTLSLGGDRHVIAPGRTETIEVQAGTTSYVGAAPGVIPAIGTEDFQQGYEYDWRFWIVRKTASGSP
jgi:hypothetical protein